MIHGDTVVGETSRVRLRQLRLSDADDVAAMVADPEQMRFYARVKSRDEVDVWMAWNLTLYQAHGFGTWCLRTMPEDEFAGYCGIRPLELDGQPETELAWHVKKTHWNQGLATEAAQMSVQRGFHQFGLARLVAMVHLENHASRRVAQKLGMDAERTAIHHGERTIVYRIVT